MSRKVRSWTSLCRVVIRVMPCLLALAATTGRGDVVMDWNLIASDIFVANTSLQNPGMSSRSMAMMNLAIHDSLVLSQSSGQTFYKYSSIPTFTQANASIAAAVAAHHVLRSVYTDQAATLDNHLSTTLSGHANGEAKSAGIILGQAVGSSIVSRRQNDGFNANSQYLPTNLPGRWTPDPINPGQQAWGPAWGTVQPFSIPEVATFAPPAPPALDSPQYAQSFNEAKSLGSVNSTTRTQDQTNIGHFWAYDRVGMGTPMRLYNQALRNIAAAQGNTVEQNAELFAKAAVAMADAGIVAWDSKFEHDLWRPVTAIRSADQDGNPLTIADANWVPLGAPEVTGPNFTPPFPTYVSGHASFGTALFITIEEFYGTDQIGFSLASDELGGQLRHFDDLQEAIEENGRSRVFLGIHWDFDDLAARDVGADVARFVSRNSFVAAVPEPGHVKLFIALALSVLRQRTRGSSVAKRIA